MSLVDEIVLVVRTRSFGRVGIINLDDVEDAKLIKRFNGVGAWNLTLPNDAPMVSNLKSPGTGLIAYLRDQVFISGPMLNWVKSETRDDPIGTTTYTGADDMFWLASAKAYPTPSSANVAAQTSAYDIRTGVCETVMKQYVNANIGAGAPAVRRSPVNNTMVIAANLARGSSVNYSARFDQLGIVLQDLASASGLGFDVIHSDSDHAPKFDVYVPQDRTGSVRMDISNDLLDSTQSGISAPKTTRAIVAGQGEGAARTFIEVHDSDSDDAEQLWGMRIETFIDQRNTDDPTELTQSGTDEITSNGRTIVSLKVEPTDGETMVFGRDWFLGDLVGVIIDDQVVVDTVTEAILIINDTVRLGASIGDPVGYDWESVLTDKVKSHEKRIAFLEKNS